MTLFPGSSLTAHRVLVVAFAIALAACSSADSAVIDTAPVVVEDWLVAVDDSEFEAATARTYEPAMAIVIALENDLTTAETASFLTEGIPASVSAAYWTSFQDGFDSFAGYPLSDLDVGGSEEIFAEGVQFAAVAVTDPAEGDGTIFTRDDRDRQVDLVATLAPGFVDPLIRTYSELPVGSDGDVVRAAYEQTVVPAMWAAISSGQYDDEFTRRALALIGSVTTVTSPTP
jgi:hypothetical protein